MTNTITTNRAEQIIELHDVVVSSAKMTIDAGIEAGRLLDEQKRDLPHGQFGKWIKSSLPFTDRTARNYMTLWSRRELLKTETVSDFSSAYRLLRTGFNKTEDADKAHKKSEARIREALKNKAIGEQAEPIDAEFVEDAQLDGIRQAAGDTRDAAVDADFAELEQALVKVDQKGRALSREVALFLAKAREMNATQVRSLQSFFISTTFMRMLPDCYKLMELFGIDTSRQDDDHIK